MATEPMDYDWDSYYEQCDDLDCRPALREPTLEELDDEGRRIDGDDDLNDPDFWNDYPVDDVPSKEALFHLRDGTIFLVDGDRFMDECMLRMLRPVKPSRKSSNWTRMGDTRLLNRRIRQLAKSWQCSEFEASNRFFGYMVDHRGRIIDLSHLKPNHVFPVKRYRQFED